MVDYKEIENFPGYRVGDDGSIWSCKTNSGKLTSFWKKLKPHGCRGGLLIDLSHKGKKSRFLVHRLVLTAFIGPCPENMEGCHNDGNARNNKLTNLRWDTHVNNILDKVKHDTLAKGSRHGGSKLNEIQIKEARRLLDNNFISRRGLARLLNVDRKTVYNIDHRRLWRENI